jgi:uncharacterized membrane protein YfcA
MFALVFLSAGGLAPLWKGGELPGSRLPFATILTVVGSVAGALLLTKVPVRSLQMVIAVAMITVAMLSFQNRNLLEVVKSNAAPSQAQVILGYVFTFALAVYGGFFSGGYVTLLTVIFIMFFHMALIGLNTSHCGNQADESVLLCCSDRDIHLARDGGFQTRAVAWSNDVRRRTVGRTNCP